jgi:hypothetical protein
MNNKKRFLSLSLVIITVVFFTPILWWIINSLLIEPIAYYWWGIKRILDAVPQVIYWLFLIICLCFIATFYLLKEFLTAMRKPEIPGLLTGPVQSLAQSIERSKDSHFFQWLMANRLARLILMNTSISPGLENKRKKSVGDITMILSQEPPEQIEKYLNAGLNDSLNFVRGTRFLKSKNKGDSALHMNIDSVVDYVESIME